MTGVLRNRSIRWICSLYAVDAFAEWFGSVALMVLVYDHTHSATSASLLLLAKQVVPAAFVEVLGRRLDGLDVRRSLVVADLTQATALASIVMLGFGLPLFALAAVSGTAGTVARTLLRASVARGHQGDQLRAANAVINVLMSLTGLAGPAAAAFVVAAAGVSASLVVAAGLVATLALGAALMPLAASAVPAADEEAALEDVTGSPREPVLPIGAMLAIAAVFMCAFAMDEPALLPYSERVLHAGVEGYGAIFTFWGVGLAAGGVLFTRLLRHSMFGVAVSAAVTISAVYVAMGLSPSIEFTCFVAIFGGLGNGLLWVAIITAVQEATPRGQEARWAARLESVALAAPGVGIGLGGLAADLVSPRATLLVPGVALLVVVAFAAVLLRLRSASFAGVRQIFAPSIPGGSA